MPASVENVLLTGFDQRWNEYQTQFRACRRKFSEEAVHDLRVGTRRLLAALDIIRSLDSHGGVQNTRRELKNLLDELDELRDVQVLLNEVSKSSQPWKELSLFRAHLEKREHQLLRRARKQIQASRPSDINKRIYKMRARLEKHARAEGFAGRLLQSVDRLYLRAAQAAARIDAQQSTGLHRARIAFKKFRYLSEIIGPVVPHYPKRHFKRMHDLQSAMGDIRDLEIFLAALTEFFKTPPLSMARKAAAFDEEPIRRTYQKRHGDLVAAYLEHRSELSEFWRGAPEQPFPWEQTNDPLHHSSRHRGGGGPTQPRRTRQPPPSDGQRPQQNATDRNGIDEATGVHRLNPEQSVPARDPNGRRPGEQV